MARAIGEMGRCHKIDRRTPRQRKIDNALTVIIYIAAAVLLGMAFVATL